MKKKVFEKKYANQSKAIDEIDSHGWEYTGRRGFITKHDYYEGVLLKRIESGYYCKSISALKDIKYFEIEDELILKLSSDGHITVYETSNSGLGGTSGLPKIKTTKQVFDYRLKISQNLMKKYKHKDCFICYDHYEKE
jgi:hypothetical protein